MASIFLPFFLWSLAASVSLSTCATAPQCATPVSAALAAQFGVVNTTAANELVAANIVDYSPVYSSLSQCLDVVCVIPLQSQLVGLDLSYRSINETMSSLTVQLNFMIRVWTNCTAAAKVNKTLNCDLQNRLMGRVNEKMELILQQQLAFLEELIGQCLGNTVCETYVGLQINSTSTQISRRLSFENANVLLANRILYCSDSNGDCYDVLLKALRLGFRTVLTVFPAPGLINETSLNTAYNELVLEASTVTDPFMCVLLLHNFTFPVLASFVACNDLKVCTGRTFFNRMQSVLQVFWRRLSDLRLLLLLLNTRWCTTELCSVQLQQFERNVTVASTAMRDLYFQFTEKNPASMSIALVLVGIMVASVVMIAGVALLIASRIWKVVAQQIYIVLIVLVVCGQSVHLGLWIFQYLVFAFPFATNWVMFTKFLTSFGALNRLSELSIVLALGLFVYEFFRGVYMDMLHRSVKHVKVGKFILLLGAVIVSVFSIATTIYYIYVVSVGPTNSTYVWISEASEKFLLAISFLFAIGLLVLCITVLSQISQDSKAKAKYLVPALRMLLVAIVLTLCMTIRIVVYTYSVFGPVQFSAWFYFGMLYFVSEFIAEALLLLAIFFRFYSFRARQIMSKSMQELNEPLLNRDSDNDIDELVDKPIPLRYRI